MINLLVPPLKETFPVLDLEENRLIVMEELVSHQATERLTTTEEN
jgi:hypothetical protein